MAYLRSDPEAVAYVERLLDRAAEMGVSREQMRRPYGVNAPAPNRTTTPTFARIVGWAVAVACKRAGVSPCVASRAVGANQDFFRVAGVRAEARVNDVAPVLAALIAGIASPSGEPAKRGRPISHRMSEFSTTSADAAAYRARLRRAAIIAGERK